MSLPASYRPHFGWKPSGSTPAAVTRYAKAPGQAARVGRAPIATNVDLRPAVLAARQYGPTAGWTPILDQGPTSSCVAHAGSVAVRTHRFAEALARGASNSELDAIDLPSLLFGYKGARRGTGNEHEDDGTQIQTWFDFSSKVGMPDEHDPALGLAFDPSRINENVVDDALVLRAAHDAKGIEGVERLDAPGIVGADLEALIDEALSNREPIVAGFPLDAGFFRLAAGEVYRRTGAWEGNHALAIIGYLAAQRAYIAVNSWGDAWCDGGFGLLSKDWVLDQGADIHRFRSKP